MEIREFAERVLFAETLEEKLTTPPVGRLTDAEPGMPMPAPGGPGRPTGLHFSQRGTRARLPRADELHNDEARAVLLHSFANHELLAVELHEVTLTADPAYADTSIAMRSKPVQQLCIDLNRAWMETV